MTEFDRPASEEEQRAAVALRDALDGKAIHPDLSLVAAIRAAARPQPIAPARHDAMLRRALSHRRRTYGLVGAAGALALAAAAALVLWRAEPPLPSAGVRSRSAADLFQEQFPVVGGTTERVDRIAISRQRELRDSLFSAWETR
jgi:hypothetical protein